MKMGKQLLTQKIKDIPEGILDLNFCRKCKNGVDNYNQYLKTKPHPTIINNMLCNKCFWVKINNISWNTK